VHPQPRIVTTSHELATLASQARVEQEVALDIEANGRFAYRPRASTLQIAWPGQVVIVDPLASEIAGDLAPLAPLLSAEGPVKVVHDVGFDARMLAQAGVHLGNVHDTALAAQWVGRPATGLASLLSAELGVVLDKSLQAQDWAHRPLSPRSVDYLARDVAHLLELHGRLWDDVLRLDIESEIKVETDYRIGTAEQAIREPDLRPPFVRVKGARDLSPSELAVLRPLALAREAEAERLDLPSTELVPSGYLLALAKRYADKRLRSPVTLPRLPFRLSRDDEQRLATALARAAWEGLDTSSVPEAEMRHLHPARPSAADAKLGRRREARLSAWRKGEAALRGVIDQVVLPGHCLTDIVAASPRDATELARVPGIGATRIERYGQAILCAIAEEPSP
jgi:ribonuclease D